MPPNPPLKVDPDVADEVRSVIIDQIRNGVSVRMAVLFLLLGSGSELVPAETAVPEAV